MLMSNNIPAQNSKWTMNSPATANFSLFSHAASLSMLQNMQNYAGQLRQMPSYFISGSSLPNSIGLKCSTAGSLHNMVPPPLTPSTNSSLLNARLISPTTEPQQPPQQQHQKQQQQQVSPKEQQQQQQQASPKVKKHDESITGEFVETKLEGKEIFAFSVGGEKRLCLPQVLNNVLLCAGVTLTDINRVCEDLNICCKRCSPQQMAILKERNVFGPNLENCGLITKSDAERLCKALLHGAASKYSGSRSGEDGISVYHSCFGKQRGFLIPRLYTNPEAACIVCDGCQCLYSPEHFVGHAHLRPERETCHWGFDSTNWRRYLLLDKRLTDSPADGCLADGERACLEKVLDDFKAKFDRKRQHVAATETQVPAKRSRQEEQEADSSKFVPPPPPIISSGSARGPLPQQLRQSTSVPLNPESIVLLNQQTASEHRDFAPNVRLAPAPIRLSPLKPEPVKVESEPSSIEDSIASDWESLTDWGEGHLPEKATPQFLAMVEKVKSGYQSRIDGLSAQVAQLRTRLEASERSDEELKRLRRQLEEQRSPDVRKLRMKYSAQKEEIKQLEAERQRLQQQLEAATADSKPLDDAQQLSKDATPAPDASATVLRLRPATNGGAKVDEDGPPSLEMQCVS